MRSYVQETLSLAVDSIGSRLFYTDGISGEVCSVTMVMVAMVTVAMVTVLP